MIVRKYEQPLTNYLGRMTGEREAALDFAQEVFLKVYCSLGSYRPAYKFSTWLFKIASNHLIDHWRKKKLPTLSLDQPVDDEDGSLTAPGRRPGAVGRPEVRAGRDPAEDRAGPGVHPGGLPGAVRPEARQRVLLRGDRGHQEPARRDGQEPRLSGQGNAPEKDGGDRDGLPARREPLPLSRGRARPVRTARARGPSRALPGLPRGPGREAPPPRGLHQPAAVRGPAGFRPVGHGQAARARGGQGRLAGAPSSPATAALVIGLLGFYLLTGASLSDVLVAVNRFFGSAFGRAPASRSPSCSRSAAFS